MSNTLVFLLVLSILVSFHEFGHLIVAKACGMKVDVYSIGFGPKLFKFKMGETEYCLSLIPLGGYVSPAGPNFKEDIDPNDPEKDRYFISKPVWKRALMIAAGPLFNFLLAIILMTGMIYSNGSILKITTVVGQVVENSPANKAGLQKGDLILAVNGMKVNDWRDIVLSIQESNGQKLILKIERNKNVLDVAVVPEFRDQRMIIGIAPAVKEKKIGNLAVALIEGVRQVGDETKFQAKAMRSLAMQKLSSKNLGGPVMIFKITSQAAKEGLPAIIGLMIILNIALGFFNLLPIPILDGGHLFFCGIEALLGRPVGKEIQIFAQNAGLLLLLFIMVFATFNDISRLKNK